MNNFVLPVLTGFYNNISLIKQGLFFDQIDERTTSPGRAKAKVTSCHLKTNPVTRNVKQFKYTVLTDPAVSLKTNSYAVK